MPFNRSTTKKYARYVLRWCIATAVLVLFLYEPIRLLYATGGWWAVLEAWGIFFGIIAISSCAGYTCWWAFSND